MTSLPSWWPSSKQYVIGDSLEVMKKIPDKSIDVVLTDPPYNVSLKYNGYDDDKSHQEYLNFSLKWFIETKRIARNVIFTPGRANLKMWLTEIEYPRGICIWYVPNQLSHQNMKGWCHWEPILLYGSIAMSKDAFHQPIGYQSIVGSDHPCPKPVKLFRQIIKSLRPRPEIILDPFSGSGTTLRACADVGNILGLGIEIDASYEEVIQRRLGCYVYNHHNVLDFGKQSTSTPQIDSE